MKSKLKDIYSSNKAIFWALLVALIITVGILVKIKDEVTRFTLIMPVFAGFILFSILVTSDEDLEDEVENQEEEEGEKETLKDKKKIATKAKPKNKTGKKTR